MTPEIVRNLLVTLTGLIPNDEIASFSFAASLLATDHIFNVVDQVIG